MFGVNSLKWIVSNWRNCQKEQFFKVEIYKNFEYFESVD